MTFEDNQPVIIATTGEWGRVTGRKIWTDTEKPTLLYRVEFPDGREQWHESKNVIKSSTLAALNTPYFWIVGAVFVLVALCAAGVL